MHCTSNCNNSWYRYYNFRGSTVRIIATTLSVNTKNKTKSKLYLLYLTLVEVRKITENSKYNFLKIVVYHVTYLKMSIFFFGNLYICNEFNTH